VTTSAKPTPAPRAAGWRSQMPDSSLSDSNGTSSISGATWSRRRMQSVPIISSLFTIRKSD